MPDSRHVVPIRPEPLLDAIRVEGDGDEILEQDPLLGPHRHRGSRVPAETAWDLWSASDGGGDVPLGLRCGDFVLDGGSPWSSVGRGRDYYKSRWLPQVDAEQLSANVQDGLSTPAGGVFCHVPLRCSPRARCSHRAGS